MTPVSGMTYCHVSKLWSDCKVKLTAFGLVEAELDGKKDTLSIDIIHAEIMLQLDSACQRQWLVSPGSTPHVGWEVVNWADYDPVSVEGQQGIGGVSARFLPPSSYLLIDYFDSIPDVAAKNISKFNAQTAGISRFMAPLRIEKIESE